MQSWRACSGPCKAGHVALIKAPAPRFPPADFMLRPRQTVTLNVPLHRPGAEGKKAKNRAAGARTSESKGECRGAGLLAGPAACAEQVPAACCTRLSSLHRLHL